MGGLLELALQILVPSWWEIDISLGLAIVIVVICSVLPHTSSWTSCPSEDRNFSLQASTDQAAGTASCQDSSGSHPSYKVSTKADIGIPTFYSVKLQLLAAKNLMAANLNGTSDPYAVLTCGSQTRFSSMVPGSRNPMWGEEFDFYTDELPVQLNVAIYDWDIFWKGTQLGSTTLEIKEECETEAVWHTLDRASGQVCLQTCTRALLQNSTVVSNGLPAAARRRLSLDKPVGTEVRQKPGPLQTIFQLAPDEVVEHSYSCAMERSFLYHGRMYLSASHVCFHSNVFAKQLKVVLAFQDVEEIRRSQHALINPAITIVLRAGSGGVGVPPLSSPDGRAKYKFASFWNRNHTHRVLLRAARNFQAMEEAMKMEEEQAALRTQNSLARKIAESSRSAGPFQPFLKDNILVEIIKMDILCTVQQFFSVILSDDSRFTEKCRAQRKDTDLKVEKWNPAEDYGGFVRKITFRSKCHSPMCPPDTAMTEWQHVAFSGDKKSLVFESVQQAHDVPFGSYFEVHAKWVIQKVSETTCMVVVKVGTHIKKWSVMQSKIKSGTEKEYKVDAGLMMELAQRFLEVAKSSDLLVREGPHA